MHCIQYDPHVKHHAYGQHGPEEDCANAEDYGRDYVYVYSAGGSGYSSAGPLAGVGAGGWSAIRQCAADSDIDLASRRAWNVGGLASLRGDA